MGTTRGLERLIFFTDAVAAIAITLLILPLVDLVPDAVAHHETIETLLRDHVDQLASFVLSFAVIGRLWIAHHAIFEHVEHYDRRIVLLTFAWAFTIVFLPLPTALTSAFHPTPLPIGLYIGTMLVNSIALTMITYRVRGNPAIESPDYPVPAGMFAGSLSTAVAFAIALLLGTLVPRVGYWALLLLLLTGPVDAFWRRRVESHARAHSS
jgi:uncharacterized membrane protein